MVPYELMLSLGASLSSGLWWWMHPVNILLHLPTIDFLMEFLVLKAPWSSAWLRMDPTLCILRLILPLAPVPLALQTLKPQLLLGLDFTAADCEENEGGASS